MIDSIKKHFGIDTKSDKELKAQNVALKALRKKLKLLGKMQGDFTDKQSIELVTNHDSIRDEIIARVLAGDSSK